MKRLKTLLVVAIVGFCTTVGGVKAFAAGTYVDSAITTETYGVDRTIRELYIGPNVSYIEISALSGLTRLSTIVVDSSNPNYASFDGCLYNKGKTQLLYEPGRGVHWYPSTLTSFVAQGLMDVSGKEANCVQQVIDDNREQYQIAAQKKAEEAKAAAEKKKAEAEAAKKAKEAEDKLKKEEAKKEKEEADAAQKKLEEEQKKADEEEKKKSTYIAYDPNGGSGTMSMGQAEKDMPFRMPKCKFTAPTGKSFVAWAIGTPDGKQVATGSYYTFTEDTIIVYAVWSGGESTSTSSSSSTSGTSSSTGSTSSTSGTSSSTGSTSSGTSSSTGSTSGTSSSTGSTSSSTSSSTGSTGTSGTTSGTTTTEGTTTTGGTTSTEGTTTTGSTTTTEGTTTSGTTAESVTTQSVESSTTYSLGTARQSRIKTWTANTSNAKAADTKASNTKTTNTKAAAAKTSTSKLTRTNTQGSDASCTNLDCDLDYINYLKDMGFVKGVKGKYAK